MSILLLCLLNAAAAPSFHDLLSHNLRVRNATIAVYEDFAHGPCAVVRIERSYTGYQRRGFFRIGALPTTILEGVTFELLATGSVSNALAHLDRWVAPGRAAGFELRRVQIRWVAGTTNSLQAGRVELGPPGQWRLSEGVRWSQNSKHLDARRATLQVAGKEVGNLVISEPQKIVGNVFSREPPVLSASRKQ